MAGEGTASGWASEGTRPALYLTPGRPSGRRWLSLWLSPSEPALVAAAVVGEACALDILEVFVDPRPNATHRFTEACSEAYKSLFFLTQKVAGTIDDGGRIVNLGSRTAGIAFAPLVSYGPIKAAVQSLTSYLASYFGKRGITVNAVAPGGLDDDFNAGLFAAMPQAKGFIASNTALSRIGVPADVAGVITFLCGKDASFINGAVLNIDGGYHL